MQKETLTYTHIQQDIRSARRENYAQLVLFIVLLLVLLGAFIAGFITSPGEFAFELPLVLIGGGVLLYKIFQHARNVSPLRAACPVQECIAKDTLINAEFVDRWKGNTYRGKYHFQFARYGDYRVPKKNYTWSKGFSMSDRGVYNYAVHGDEFYLVLSKPHSGKILFAYNTKMFELKE